MPIETPHPLYKENIERWKRCRDAYEGEDAIKKEGTAYLPKVDPTQSDAGYAAYLRRALYYEAVGRTVDGFVGAISRKPHVIKMPAAMGVFETNTTIDGTGLSEFIKRLAAETVLQARGGVLVDFNESKQRTYLSMYCVESITNWSANSIVVLETIYEADPEDQYTQVEIQQYRQLHIQNGVYTVTVWRKAPDPATGGSAWSPYSEIVPTKRGAPLTEIPWFWFSSMGQSAEIEKPPLLGLVNTALSHYRSSADLEHGRHFTALPTLYITGVKTDSPIEVGAGAVIKLSDPQSKCGYAEFTGQGLGSLENALEQKEKQMAMLGAAVFGGGKKGVEAAETARIRTAGETSLLMGVVSAVEETLTAALVVAADWMFAGGGIQVKINRDFMDQQLNPQTIVGLVQAYQAGMLNLEMFLFCLDQAEMLPPGTDITQAADKLRADGPPVSATPPKQPAVQEASVGGAEK